MAPTTKPGSVVIMIRNDTDENTQLIPLSRTQAEHLFERMRVSLDVAKGLLSQEDYNEIFEDTDEEDPST